jgi:hypothetical protein
VIEKESILNDSLSIQIEMSFGSSETDVNEFAVKPRGFLFLSRQETTVTPVGKEPRACLKFLVLSLFIL